MSISKIFIALACLVIVGATMRYYYLKHDLEAKIEEIKSNMQVANGTVTRVRFVSNRGPQDVIIDYVYIVNGVTLHGIKDLAASDLNRNEDLTGKQFPVIYSSEHINTSEILLSADDSEKYNLH